MRAPFAQLVTKSEEFSFDMSYIQHLRRDMKTLLENLSIIYSDWKKEEQTGATSALIQRARVEGGSSQEKKPKPSGEFQCTRDPLKLAAITDQTVFRFRSKEAKNGR